MELPNLRDETYRLLGQVPAGQVTTYGALAAALGAPEAARLVGEYMATNPNAPDVPCHRVVLSDGKVGKYTSIRGVAQKIELLASEGVAVRNGKIVDFDSIRFLDFEANRPLEKLRKYQLSLREKLVLHDRPEPPSNLVAVDVAYSGEGAFAAGALHGFIDGRPGPTFWVHATVDFPYIPTFLGFREIPAIRAALKYLPEVPDLLLVDGNGTLHPHGIGIASQAGIELGIPTIGVAKSLLCGKMAAGPQKVGDTAPVEVGGTFPGHALRVSNSKNGLVYVSPGHLVSPERSVEIVRGLIVSGAVEPLRRAHLAASEASATFKSARTIAKNR